MLILFAIIACINVNAQTKRLAAFDTPAKFTERNADFISYLAKNVKMPNYIANDVKAPFTVRIKIDQYGTASVDTITKHAFPEVDAEFVKAIQASPKWIPAQLKGNPVVYYLMGYFNVECIKATSTMAVFPLNARQPISFDKLYNAVTKNPTFPGGEKGLAEFLKDNIRYPDEARINNVMGRAFVQFVVERDGSLSDFKVVRDPGSGLGDEALRVLKKSPKWIPGTLRDTAVRVQYTVPINFSRQ